MDKDKTEKAIKKAIKNEVSPLLIGLRNELRDIGDSMRESASVAMRMEFTPEFIKEMHHHDGKTPLKGIDYFTDDEINGIIKIATPKKGKDYFTKKEIADFKKSVTPQKGTDYRDGITPVKGVDYFNDDDIAYIVKESTPVKGYDYFTKKEINAFLKQVTPVKGIDYKDGTDGTQVSPLFIRDSLEGLTGHDRLKIKAIDGLQEMLNALSTSNGSQGGPATGADTPLSPTGVQPGDYTSANITVNQYGQITKAANGSGGGGGSPGGNQYDLQLNDGSGGFTGSDNLNFQGGYLTINGDSGYGQLQWLNASNTDGFAGSGISGTDDEIIIGALAGDMTIWSSQAMNFSADSGSTNMLRLNEDGSIVLGHYGSGTFTGTPTYSLQVDAFGNIIEGPIGGGSGSPAGENYSVQYNNSGAFAGSFVLFDSGGTGSIDIINKQLLSSDGTTVSVDWANGALLDAGGVPSVLWQGRLLYDNNNFQAFDWVGRQLTYTDGATTIMDWANFKIFDSSAELAIDWGQRRAYDAGGIGHDSILWDLRWLTDTATDLSLDWDNRLTEDTSGEVSINWETRQLFYTDGLTPVVDWGQVRLVDLSDVISLAWDSRLLNDTVGSPSVDWGNHQLIQSNGGIAYDWQAGIFNEPANTANIPLVDLSLQYLYYYNGEPDTSASIQWNDGLANDASGIESISWAQRQLYDPTGNLSVDYGEYALWTPGETLATIYWNVGNMNYLGGSTSVDWFNSDLYDTAGQRSVSWEARALKDETGAQVLAWSSTGIVVGAYTLPLTDGTSGQVLGTDGMGTVSWISAPAPAAAGANFAVQYNNAGVIDGTFQLFGSGGGATVDIDALNLLNSLGQVTVDWLNLFLFDASDIIAVDWAGRHLADFAGQYSFNFDERALIYPDGVNPAVYWGSGEAALNDPAGFTSVDWLNRNLEDSAQFISLDWNVRQLLYTDGTTIVVDWSVGILNYIDTSPGVPSLNWDNGSTYDLNGIQSIFWRGRTLNDSNVGLLSVDWDGRILYANDGMTNVFEWDDTFGPRTITQDPLDNSTRVATTAYVDAAVAAGGGSGVMTLLKSGSGSTTNISAETLDSIVIGALTALDTIKVVMTFNGAAPTVTLDQTDPENIYTVNYLTGGVFLVEVVIKNYISSTSDVIAADITKALQTSSTWVTPWTSGFTLQLNQAGVVTGTLDWQWQVYKISGQ